MRHTLLSGLAAPVARVICMGCGQTWPRQPFQEQLEQLNPGAAEAVRQMQAGAEDGEELRQRALRIGAGERAVAQVMRSSRVMMVGTTGAVLRSTLHAIM